MRKQAVLSITAILAAAITSALPMQTMAAEKQEAYFAKAVTVDGQAIKDIWENAERTGYFLPGGNCIIITKPCPPGSGNPNPDNPGGGNPDNPGGGNPDNPGGGNPDNPGDGTPDNPGDGTPDNPGDGTPDNPGDSTPDNPGGGNPDNPGGGNPDNPGGGTPDNPGGGAPDNPGTGTPDNPGTDTPEPDQPEEEKPTLSYAEQVVELVNRERAKAGLKPLSIQRDVETAAITRAKEIKRSFSHTRPDGTSFTTALMEQGVSYRGAGENIAWGQKSPQQVMDAWMNSEGHRANILNGKFTHIGVGHYQDTEGTNYWTQLFTY